VTGQSLFQRRPTECGVSECDLETSTIRRPRPARAVRPWKKKKCVCVCVLMLDTAVNV
jgi:hypothetical protein